jgi:hypothetical protein
MPTLPLGVLFHPPHQVTNVKLALTDDKFTYEPSYNLVKKAPSLAVSRPVGAGKYKVSRQGGRGWGRGVQGRGSSSGKPYTVWQQVYG